MLAALYATIVLIFTVVLSVNWTPPLSINLLVFAAGIVITAATAAVVYVQLGRR